MTARRVPDATAADHAAAAVAAAAAGVVWSGGGSNLGSVCWHLGEERGTSEYGRVKVLVGRHCCVSRHVKLGQSVIAVVSGGAVGLSVVG